MKLKIGIADHGGKMLLSLRDKVKVSLIICIGFILILSLGGCSTFQTYNEATGRNEFILISTSEEIALGLSVHKSLEEELKVDSTSQTALRVKQIGYKVASASERQDLTYRFYVIDKDEINAFTTPGGNIYFYTGLLNQLKTDDQIASVLAHEIGHTAAKHTIKKYQAALGYNVISSLVLSQISGTAQSALKLSSNTVMGLVSSAYSRQDEYEADRLGIRYMNRAGYDMNATIEVFQVLQRESNGGGTPVILRSHPHVSDRIVQAKEIIAREKLGINKGL